MTLIEFPAGNPAILIDPRYIVAIERVDSATTKIHMGGDRTFVLPMPLASVLKTLDDEIVIAPNGTVSHKTRRDG